MLVKAWTWLTDDHVIGTTPDVERYFMRCDTCRRVYRHYWGCIPPGEKGQMGCTCGSVKARMAQIPSYHAAWLLLWCYVTRRLILRKTYWDPRMPARKSAPDA